MSSAICIAIPTFNRVQKLLERVRELKPQLDSGDRLFIFDNATPGFLPHEHAELNDPRIRVSINKANIGGNANIAKCLASFDTGWVWITSDDDPIKKNALSVIRSEIGKAADCCLINFAPSKGSSRTKGERVAKGLGEFLDLNDGFQNTLLLSNNVVHIDRFLPYMQAVFTGIWMNCPHVAPLISCLQNGGSMMYSAQSIVDWEPPDPKESWSIASVYTLLEMATIVSDEGLAKRLRAIIAKALPSRFRFAAELCWSQMKHGYDWRVLPYARSVLRNLSAHRGLIGRMSGYVLYQSLRRPRETFLLLSVFYRLTRKASLALTVQDRPFRPYI